MKNRLNIFGEPRDDIKQALYCSWCEFEEVLHQINMRQADMKHGYACETTEQEFLELLSNRLLDARRAIGDFAPEYHHETLEGWAQAAAEMSHP